MTEFIATLRRARKELLNEGVKADDVRLALLDYLFAWRESMKVESTYLSPEVLPDGIGIRPLPSR